MRVLVSLSVRACVCLGGSLAASYKMVSYHLNNEDFPSLAGQALAMWVFRELCAARRVCFALWMHLVNPACMNTQLLCGCYRIKHGLGSALCFLTLVNVCVPNPACKCMCKPNCSACCAPQQLANYMRHTKTSTQTCHAA